ncbi:LacI family DNA-binding transcriptional regulator [Maricaulis parjimensis]|uniref:LacI family DNA-binding transcriptional regulator n=1 Tax=Maricaulis parjimensis TaxID=144023 RepID=UPI0019399006|nr:LacI family DNA-binding transcriptional regulator [Maricaulis parjimensis]
MGKISDIAARAGVSSKTVSRILNGHPNISEKTRRKVEDAIAALGYEPRASVTALSGAGNRGIGVLFGDPDAGYQVSVYQALLDACRDAGYFLAVEAFDETDKDWGGQVKAFIERSGVRRVILVPPLCDSFEIQSLLKEMGVHFALISPSRPVSGAYSIAMDDRLAAMEMTQHLIGLGHRRIGFLSGRPGHVATLLRRQGFEEAFGLAGLPLPDESLVRSADFTFHPAMEAARSLLTLPEPPTAIFASNDEMAAAVIMVANDMGLSIPGDLSVAGFDGSQISQTIWPELTTVKQPFEAMAKLALDLVSRSDSVAGQAAGIQVLPHALVVRGSTAAKD